MPDTVRSGMVANLTEPGVHPAGAGPGEPETGMRVRLDDDAAVLSLPAGAPPFHEWALRMAFTMRRPVYVEASGGVIENVRLPIVGRVSWLGPGPDGAVRAAIDSSPGWLTLPDSAGRDRIFALLDAAYRAGGIVMLVTGDEDAVIQATAAPLDAWYLAPRFSAAAIHDIDAIPVSAVPRGKLNELFDIVVRGDCRHSGAADCIPFDYPNTGCDARAQEMCRRLAAKGYTAGKVWIFHSDAHPMWIGTHNYQRHCEIGWWFHVVPYVRIDTAAGAESVYVLDPSLFVGPVALPDFLTALHVTGRQWRVSPATAYAMNPDGRTAPETADQSTLMLEECRRKAAARRPQPPYCTTKSEAIS